MKEDIKKIEKLQKKELPTEVKRSLEDKKKALSNDKTVEK